MRGDGYPMKYYRQLAQLGCFSMEDLTRLTGNENTARSLVTSYIKKGYINRVHGNLYVSLSMETNQPIPSRFQIASSIADDACVSHHSAFEYYGCANQVFYDMYIATRKRFNDFEYDGLMYRRVYPRNRKITLNAGKIRVTGIEQTVIDSIADFEKIAGLEETVRCIQLVPSLNADKLLLALEDYNNGFLYQKTGYILEELNDEFGLPDSFFERCSNHISKAKMYLFKNHKDYLLREKWGLYAPRNLRALIEHPMALWKCNDINQRAASDDNQ